MLMDQKDAGIEIGFKTLVVDDIKNKAYAFFDKTGESWVVDLSGEYINVKAMQPAIDFIDKLTDTDSIANAFRQYKPSGTIKNWRVLVKKEANQFPLITSVAHIEDAGVRAVEKLPGFSGLNATLVINENDGTLFLQSNELQFNMPQWFRNKFNLSQLKGDIGFKFSEQDVEIQSSSIDLKNDHLKGNAKLYLYKAANQEAFFDIKAQLKQGDAAFAKLYYPVSKMTPQLLKWLDTSIKKGKITNGNLHIRGPVKGFPYADGQGVFKASFDVENGRLSFLPEWPDTKSVSAHVRFNRVSMNIEGKKATALGSRIKSAKVSIANLKRPIIKLHAEVAGDLPSFMRYVENSPLAETLEPVIADSTGHGAATLALDLKIPLIKSKQSPLTINGEVLFNKNRWHSKKFGFDLHSITGPLAFTQNSLFSKGISAKYFGKPVLIKAKINPKQKNLFTQLTVQGEVAARQVLQNYNLPIDHWFEGYSPWELTLDVRRPSIANKPMQVKLSARSTLKGTSVLLPPPYRKRADKVQTMHVEGDFSETNAGMLWRFTYADDLLARIKTSPDTGEMEALQVLFNQTDEKELKPGIQVAGSMKTLAFDAWITALSQVIEKIPESEAPKKLMPLRASLSVDRLLVGKVNAGPAKINGSSSSDYMGIGMTSKWLAGSLQYPRQYWDKSKPLKSELVLLDKQFIDALATADGEGSRMDPRTLPALDISVRTFVWDEYRIADMKVRSVPVADGLKTKTLGFVHNHLQMTGEAYWQISRKQSDKKGGDFSHHTKVDFQLKSNDVGRGMNHIGIKDAFADGEGLIKVNLAWNDAAYAPAFDEITGGIDLSLDKGRILAVEPGAAKILGLFAMQSVPRRLLLDFQDLTREGLLYDEIRGKFDIANGIANTQFMRMNGPIGVVSSKGSTDFIDNTYDQKVTVIPRLSSTLPIIGLISGGATAGVGVLVADQVLKGLGVNFDEIGKREYLLTGSWDVPTITRVHTPMKRLPEPDNR
jgi:uncharacterized protein (TIGR02099 family)